MNLMRFEMEIIFCDAHTHKKLTVTMSCFVRDLKLDAQGLGRDRFLFGRDYRDLV